MHGKLTPGKALLRGLVAGRAPQPLFSMRSSASSRECRELGIYAEWIYGRHPATSEVETALLPLGKRSAPITYEPSQGLLRALNFHRARTPPTSPWIAYVMAPSTHPARRH